MTNFLIFKKHKNTFHRALAGFLLLAMGAIILAALGLQYISFVWKSAFPIIALCL